MVLVSEARCDECEVCAATQAAEAAAVLDTDPAPAEREGRRRRNTCARCGHPQRLHRPVPDGYEPVVGAPLPVDLPAFVAVDPGPVPTPAPAPVQPHAPAGDSFVDRIRELTELYRAGMLDDEEFAAAKAIVLRSNQR